jgi:hypothetical protein
MKDSYDNQNEPLTTRLIYMRTGLITADGLGDNVISNFITLT